MNMRRFMRRLLRVIRKKDDETNFGVNATFKYQNPNFKSIINAKF